MQNNQGGQNLQQKGLVKKPQVQNKLDNSLTYHRWFIGMQCRKDILLQNEVINKKIVKKVTPFSTRLQSQLKNNKMRFAYFFGFCVVFSMDKLYDMIILENTSILKANKYIQTALSPKSNILKWQQQSLQRIKQSAPNDERERKLSAIFDQLDRKCLLTPAFMSKLGQSMNRSNENSYKYDYVDVGTFFEYLKNESIEDVKSKIRGDFPYLNLQL